MECEHDWQKGGPFFLITAMARKEPSLHPPSGLSYIEYCSKCGLIRLGEDLRKAKGANLEEAGLVIVQEKPLIEVP